MDFTVSRESSVSTSWPASRAASLFRSSLPAAFSVAAVSRFAVEWTDEILPALETRPEILEAEVQAIRMGEVYLVANPSELFTTLGLELRRRCPLDELFMLSYSNGSIGYLPDAYDVERRSYAAVQSAKFTGQFPFTKESGPAMVDGMLGALESVGGQ